MDDKVNEKRPSTVSAAVEGVDRYLFQYVVGFSGDY